MTEALRGATGRGSVFGLTPALLPEAARRIAALAPAAAVLSVAAFLGHRLVQPSLPVFADPIVRLCLLAVVLAAAGIVALRRYQVVTDDVVLFAGALFEPAMAFTIAMTESAVPLNGRAPLVGVSAVSLWILAFGLLIPMRSTWALVLPLADATMWPLAYAINRARLGSEPAAFPLLAFWVGGNYAVALLTYAARRYLFAFQAAAQDARALGSYTLVSRIGAGGMGEVWKARHHMLARDAAIKIVDRKLIESISRSEARIAVKRFEREAKVTASLQSPHTVYVYDFGTSEAGDFYYVMELLDGINLQALVTRFGSQPASRVVAILKQMCESLAEAHALGLVHRDLKPSNVMLCKVALAYDHVKVLDFGLVKPLRPMQTSVLTLEGAFGGTPGYVAPEVALGDRNVDARADLYGLGCIAYFLLTGSLVFPGLDGTAAALKHLQAIPEPPSRRAQTPIPPGLDQLVLDCIAKAPADRPASAREIAERLDRSGAASWTPADAERWWHAHMGRESIAAKSS